MNQMNGSRLYTLKVWPPVASAGSGYHCEGFAYRGLVKSGTPRRADLIWFVMAVWIAPFCFGRKAGPTFPPMMFPSSGIEAFSVPGLTVRLIVLITRYTFCAKAWA